MKNFFCIELGRTSLEKIIKPTHEFVIDFCAQVRSLIPHDFIAKKQSDYLTTRKDQLQRGEYVVISDFSENYTFVIQVYKCLSFVSLIGDD